MKLLLDECVSRYIKPDFVGHEVHTVEEAGVKGLKNGALLRTASERYEVLVTVDKGMAHQQNLAGLRIAILILQARSNGYDSLAPLIRAAVTELQYIQPGTIVCVGPR